MPNVSRLHPLGSTPRRPCPFVAGLVGTLPCWPEPLDRQQPGHDHTDPSHLLGLLRPCRHRPCRHAADERDEIAALQLIELHPMTGRLGTIIG